MSDESRNITILDITEAEKAAKVRLASDEVQATLVGHQQSDMRAEIEKATQRLRAAAPMPVRHAAYILLTEARSDQREFGFSTSETAAAISMLADALNIRAEYEASKKEHATAQSGRVFTEEEIRDAGALTARCLLSNLPYLAKGHVAAELEITATNTAEQIILRTPQLTAENIAATMAARAKHYSRSLDLADAQQARSLREIDMSYNAFADTLGIKHLYLQAKISLSRQSSPDDPTPLRS